MVFQRIHNGLKLNPTVPFNDTSLMLPALNLMLIEASANVIASSTVDAMLDSTIKK